MTMVASATTARIRHLLAQAESTENVKEAEAFTEKAAALMARYGVERAMLADSEPETDAIGDSERIVLEAPYARDKATLLNHVAEALGCKMVLHPGRSRVSATVFGFQSDRERVDMLFTSLLVQAAYAMAVAPVPFGESPRAFRGSWYEGFSVAVYQRLKAAEDQARKQADDESLRTGARSTALVLADRGARVEVAWKARTEGFKTVTRKLSGSGHAAGYRDGSRADLGNKRIADVGNRRMLNGSRN